MIRRRVFAFVILIVFAIGSSLFWNDGEIKWLSMSVNLIAACAGMIFLHYRWRAQERRALSPGKLKDIFS